MTVEKKTGYTSLRDKFGNTIEAEIIDLPGTYSLYPKSPEERIPFQLLCDPQNEAHPDLTIVVADGANLKRNLFLASQLVDLKIPVVLVINMMDIVRFKKININFEKLSVRLGVPIVSMNARKQEGLKELKEAIAKPFSPPANDFIDIRPFAPEVIDTIRQTVNVNSNYNAFLVANNLDLISNFEIPEFKKEKIRAVCAQYEFNAQQMQAKETLERYRVISTIMNEFISSPENPIQKSPSYRIDNVLTHRFWGYFIFLAVLFGLSGNICVGSLPYGPD